MLAPAACPDDKAGAPGGSAVTAAALEDSLAAASVRARLMTCIYRANASRVTCRNRNPSSGFGSQDLGGWCHCLVYKCRCAACTAEASWVPPCKSSSNLSLGYNLFVEVQVPAKSTWSAFHTTMSVWCLNWVMTVFIGTAKGSHWQCDHKHSVIVVSVPSLLHACCWSASKLYAFIMAAQHV